MAFEISWFLYCSVLWCKSINKSRGTTFAKILRCTYSCDDLGPRMSLCICAVWSEFSQNTRWVVTDPTVFKRTTKIDQIVRMQRLIWVFAMRICNHVKMLCIDSSIIITNTCTSKVMLIHTHTWNVKKNDISSKSKAFSSLGHSVYKLLLC